MDDLDEAITALKALANTPGARELSDIGTEIDRIERTHGTRRALQALLTLPRLTILALLRHRDDDIDEVYNRDVSTGIPAGYDL